jgi:SWI/SNF-related matrix-associated actin-dependent regulator of chromatin subfamily A member 5
LITSRDNISAVAADIEGKTLKEVKAYAKVFWDRYKEISGTFH